jgi:hypothetical protein
MAIVPTAPELGLLDLRDNNISILGVLNICDVFQVNNYIASLDFRGNKILIQSEAVRSQLINQVSEAINLTEFQLDNVTCFVPGVPVVKAIQEICQNHSLWKDIYAKEVIYCYIMRRNYKFFDPACLQLIMAFTEIPVAVDCELKDVPLNLQIATRSKSQ